MDLILQLLIIVAAVGTLLSALKVDLLLPTVWLIRISLIGYITIGTFLVYTRIGTDQPIALIGVSFAFFLVMVLAAARRRGDATETFAAASMVMCSIGVLWAMRLLASGSLGIRTILIMAAAGLIVVVAALGLRLLAALGRVPSAALALAGIVFLALPAVTFSRVNGAMIGVSLPFIGDAQPGEIGRVVLVLWLARSVAHWRPALVLDLASTTRERITLAINITLPILIGVAVGFLSNDLGPALVLILASAAVIFMGGLGWRWIAWTSLWAIAAVSVLLSVSTKVAARLATLTDPLAPAASGGLSQVGIGLVAMAHSPMGLGNGAVTVIPNWHNDMILAAIGHELGMSHLIAILAAVTAMAFSTPGLMARAVDDRSKLAISGLVAVLVTQTLLMTGAILAVAPLTGMPVPFVSMSGSSILTTALTFALVISSGRGPRTPMSPALTRRALIWSVFTILVAIALGARAVTLHLAAADTLVQAGAHDRVAARISKAATGTILTADGFPIYEVGSTDGKPARLANFEAKLGHESYASLMRPSDQPGLEAIISGRNDCLFDDCPTTTTTLVHAVQVAAWEKMQDKTGAVIAVDLRTGGLLAYVSTTAGLPGIDRVRQQTIAPGSTAKPITAAAAVMQLLQLERQAITAYSYEGGGVVTSMSGNPCGSSLDAAMAYSCNPYFAALGDEIGAQQLSDLSSTWLNAQDTLEGMPITTSSLVRPNDGPGFAALGAIGLGNAQVTPIGMLSATATIARGGRSVCMHLLEHTNSDCTERPVMDETAAHETGQAMRAVTTEGTARDIPGIQALEVAAKTGTADYTAALTNATFTAFAPASNPSVAVVVFLQPGPQETAGLMGGKDAGPIGVAVLEAALHR